jgi:hypothetical protein
MVDRAFSFPLAAAYRRSDIIRYGSGSVPNENGKKSGPEIYNRPVLC